MLFTSRALFNKKKRINTFFFFALNFHSGWFFIECFYCNNFLMKVYFYSFDTLNNFISNSVTSDVIVRRREQNVKNEIVPCNTISIIFVNKYEKHVQNQQGKHFPLEFTQKLKKMLWTHKCLSLCICLMLVFFDFDGFLFYYSFFFVFIFIRFLYIYCFYSKF